MSYGIKLHVWGDNACFSRPEMKVERVSYDVITPSAARGILEAIHWKPAIRWVVDRIQVLNEIRFENIRRNEVAGKLLASSVKAAMSGKTTALAQVVTEERQQRATLMLKQPAYVIEAHFEMTGAAGAEDTPEKHYNIFLRRARQGQCFQQPYFGCREFAAQFALIEDRDVLPTSFYEHAGEKDLGWMLYDIDFARNMEPQFFRAIMHNGWLELAKLRERR
ncbi:type I-C CRISPR-associated protein Cas5 [Paenibacillus athensensis]|uniref:pre-crRNA processing endonuclease n=1 Tax=Paenibacillus athensensis TaxID=1967502 RepID=A0A4Y8PX33_9BACL|nr:type I-C CRISPR-associated protein Cas5c [Paenibacillus athensensis]MCD1258065.1 type I-C CRISPR-associated protein Cas5 [Paenibacillus athensensis]